MAKYIISKINLVDNLFDFLQITQNIDDNKEVICQYLTQDALKKIEQFVVFINQNPKISEKYKLFLEEERKNYILEDIPYDNTP
ncbi:MAG: hypothetical protein ATN31_08300 [Candidatus Epulonipiscioides saccharophilum]|nr:MAG: hypothetical protein ATN31_08300 [Epulopiscium sp. AS2M-Bin001]